MGTEQVYAKRVTVELSDGSVEIYDNNVFVVSTQDGWQTVASNEVTQDMILSYAYDTVDAIEFEKLQAELIE